MPRFQFSLFPRTIFWRIASLTTIAMLLSVIFVIGLFTLNRVQMVANNMTDQAGEVLANTEDELDGMPLGEQASWLASTQKPYLPHLRAIDNAEVPAADERPRTLLTRAIAKALRQQLAGVSDIRETPAPRHQLWARVDMLGRPMWLVIPLGRYFHGDPTWQIGAAALMFALLALSVASLFAWRVNRPLRKLQVAAARLGRGERPEPLPETGPLEVKALSESFNSMLADLATNERERDVMLAGISHDLRTPLARLRLGVEMMSDQSLQGGMREDVDDIERILGQFIAFSRGLGEEDATESDPAELARTLLTKYARIGCDIELELDDELPLVKLRPLALTRAMTNLVDNARRYGQSPISLSVRHNAQGLVFEVADRGPGIPDAHIADAMKPFHRLDSARRADGGSGLGIAIVERIARQHGGILKLANREGGGLSATIVLPIQA
ncbi:MAG: HAMP domain-containing protein [Burkholderiales bacterium]|nr:HAMP domain-containing protein [Burkholderiales bacterium]